MISKKLAALSLAGFLSLAGVACESEGRVDDDENGVNIEGEIDGEGEGGGEGGDE